MRSTQALLSGMPTGKKSMGWWGDVMGSLPQKNIVQYSISEFRQNPLQGMVKHHIMQGTSRLLHQLPYFLPPILVVYGVVQWATKRNEFVNSKEGKAQGYAP